MTYPVTIISARYGGVYEGGGWLAFNCYEEQVPEAASGDDVTCATFWAYYSEPVGKGKTPNEAYNDLVKKLE